MPNQTLLSLSLRRYILVAYSGRIVIYIYKRYRLNIQSSEKGTNQYKISLLNTNIYSIYSLGYKLNQITPLTALTKLLPRPYSAFIRDFNIYYPLQDSLDQTSPNINTLFKLIIQQRLKLVTPYSKVIKRALGKRNSTIDYI